MVLRKKFTQNVNAIRTKRERAKQEITQLKQLREDLVMNHLKKIYSDEVYQDQSKKIEGKIAAFEQIMGSTTFYKYTMDDVDKFMKDKFKDLGQTYLDSEPGQQRVLLGSICPSGLAWQYPGLSNQQFSLEYQAIRDSRDEQNALRVFNDELLEPIIQEITTLYKVFGHKIYAFATA